MNSPRRVRNRVACRRCQRRKIRCDGNLASCGSCQKAGVQCVNDGKQEVHRLYLANLENRARWLESLLKENCPDVDLSSGPRVSAEQPQTAIASNCEIDSGFAQSPPPGQQSRTEHVTVAHEQYPELSTPAIPQTVNDEPQRGHEIGLVSLSSGGGPCYIGPSSGYFFARRIFSRADHRRNRQEPVASVAGASGLSAELLNSPATLPPRKDNAIELSVRYFKTIHLLYPFLHEPSHMDAIERIYSSQENRASELFQVFMVLAIAALDLSRQYKVHLPVEGYYSAAMDHVEHTCGDGSVAGLQSLLLLMVYALHNPSCSLNIWNLNYQCLASVIDLGLQRDVRASSAFSISVLEQEMRTRVFWVAYTFDRVICTMMGRPIGVRDEACELRFPLDIADSDLINTNDSQLQHTQSSPLSYSIHLFKLARMNSEIKYIMHSISRDTPAYAYPPIKDIFSWQRDMIHSLQTWLTQIPQRSDSDCGRMAQLLKIRYHEIMILLLRPSPAIPYPSHDSFDLCFHHAVDLLRGFGELYRSGRLFYNRLVVHSILLSTFVMLYCIWKVPSTAAKCRVDELAADFNTSQNILSSIGEYWTEANRARDCVDEFSNVTLQRLLGNDQNQATASISSPIANRTRPRFNNAHTALSSSKIHRDTGRVNADHGQVDSHIHQQLDHTENTASTHDYINLFDDFLQGDFQGWSGMPDIDGLMWEFFH